MRMLMNNLDPDVAEKPEELIVYGGTGKAARNHEALERIISTLKRLENDDYGYCQECGDEIAPARLAVDPTVLLCIRCAEASETR